MPKRKYRSHTVWQSIIQQQKDSGLSAETRQQMGLAAREKTEKCSSLNKYKNGILNQIKSLCQ